MARRREGEMANIDADVRSLKWKLWHGKINRAVDQLERMMNEFVALRERAIWRRRAVGFGVTLVDLRPIKPKRDHRLQRAISIGRRIASALAESAVNSLVARRMVKKQQMQWSKRGAHLLLQVRAAVLNGDFKERLAYKPPRPAHRSRIAWMFEPTPPLLKAA